MADDDDGNDGKPPHESPPSPPPTIDGTELTMSPAPGATALLPAHGYKLGRTIGRGGMGEVIAAQDERIGREVAIKRMRNPRPNGEALSRFLREAKIQARLDHPSIVPVHELGIDDAGRPYFAMKRCSGQTMARLIADSGGGTFHRLLRAFVDICLAIEFAHERGVVHRDLKPANVILGDYGEVYVLDWGIARVLTDPPVVDAPPIHPEEMPDDEDSTKSGVLLGTPGYIAPEQIMGALPAPSLDVYALGCILFEILTREPLHPRGQHAIGRTLSTPQDSPARRRPDLSIPPELDAACVAALAEDPAFRPSARALGDRVQAYLDGDRDLERRRDLAAQQLAHATAALASDAPDARVTALRHGGRAVALDPESARATELVSSLLLEPPAVLPEDLRAAIADQDRKATRHRSRNAIFAYLSIVALFPIVFVLDVENWVWVATFYGVIALGILASLRHIRSGATSVPVTAAVTLAATVLFTRVAGPFVLTPLMVCCALAAMTPIPWFAERRWAILAWTVCAVMLPIGLEWTGVLPRTWEIQDRWMVVQSDVFRTSGRLEEGLLVFVSLIFSITVGLLAHSISARRRASQLKLFIQAWHLRHLVPQPRRWDTQPGNQ